jgi:hypothetical protein
MKKLFIFAASAALFAACSQSDDLALGTAQQAQAQAEETPVAFDVYAQKGTTRAGVGQEVTTGSLQSTKHSLSGFGVFAYYTDDQKFNQFATPNFMYNQQVKYVSSVWNYTPVKYWPNEFGDAAVSANVDYLSFFAYAPYIEVDPISGLPVTTTMTDADVYKAMGYDDQDAMWTGERGKDIIPDEDYSSSNPDHTTAITKWLAAARAKISSPTSNIVGISKNAATGDPMVRYIVDFNAATSVDLLWGVAPTTSEHITIAGASSDPQTDGLPYINMVKPTTTSKIKFEFRHALVRLNATIDAFVDETSSGNNVVGGTAASSFTWSDGKTRIYVRSVTIEGLAYEGLLDLNNTTAKKPLWKDINGAILANKSITIYDGRVDGSEGSKGASNSSELPQGLNPVIIQNSGDVANGVRTQAGVKNTPVNLFNGTYTSSTAQPVFAIPATVTTPKVTIVYDVETADDNVAGYLSDGKTHGSVVENKITKTLTSLTNGFEAGKQYNLALHLGMTSVKFEVSVRGWVNGEDASANLPINE